MSAWIETTACASTLRGGATGGDTGNSHGGFVLEETVDVVVTVALSDTTGILPLLSASASSLSNLAYSMKCNIRNNLVHKSIL